MKTEIVKFADGTFGVRRTRYFGMVTEFLSQRANWWWKSPGSVHDYCKFDSIEKARLALGIYRIECTVVPEQP